MSGYFDLMRGDLNRLPLPATNANVTDFVRHVNHASFVVTGVDPSNHSVRRHLACVIIDGEDHGNVARFYKPIDFQPGANRIFVPLDFIGNHYEFHLVGIDRRSGNVVEHVKFVVDTVDGI